MYLHMLTKPLPCHWGHKMYLNICLLTPPMPERTQNACHPVLTTHLPCQRGHKMKLKMCWPNPSHASEDTKCVSTCVDQTPPLVARTQSASQHMLTEFSPCQREQKMNLTMWWPNLSHASEDKKCISLYLTNPIQASEDTKCISTSVEQTLPKPARK